MPYCSALGCNNRHKSSIKNQELSFFSFPVNRHEGNLWIKNCGRVGWKPSRFNRICSAHFEEACFEVDMYVELMGQDPTKRRRRRTLKPGAVPTIFHHEQQPISGPGDRRQRYRKRPVMSNGIKVWYVVWTLPVLIPFEIALEGYLIAMTSI